MVEMFGLLHHVCYLMNEYILLESLLGTEALGTGVSISTGLHLPVFHLGHDIREHFVLVELEP